MYGNLIKTQGTKHICLVFSFTLLKMVLHDSVSCSSATGLVQVHWLEVIIWLHLHHRGPLLSDGGNVVQHSTCNNDVAPCQVQPLNLSGTEILPLVGQRSIQCVPLFCLKLH